MWNNLVITGGVFVLGAAAIVVTLWGLGLLSAKDRPRRASQWTERF